MIIFFLIIVSCGDTETRKRPEESAILKKPEERIYVYLNGTHYGSFSIDFLSDLPEVSFKTGLSDIQKGVFLYAVLNRMGIFEAKKVIIKGLGSPPVEIMWKDLIDREKKILISVTHRGTLKVVSDDPKLIKRKEWPRHIVSIDVLR